MYQDRTQQDQQAACPQQTSAVKPEYPIYQEVPDCYLIYVAGCRFLVDAETVAYLGRSTVRARRLCQTPLRVGGD